MSDQASGLKLLRERVQSAEDLILKGISAHKIELKLPDVDQWIVYGVGSSEAHARYLCALLLNNGNLSASYRQMTDPLASISSRCGKVLFSQGFSSNAVSVARDWLKGNVSDCIIVTAATPDDLSAKGAHSRASVLQELLDGGAQLVKMQLQNEYTILIRTIGPMYGYYVAYEVARALGVKLGKLEISRVQQLFDTANLVVSEAASRLVEEWKEGAPFVTIGPIGSCIQNLQLKRLEGIYEDSTPTVEFTSYAHGYFQREFARKRVQWLLCSQSEQQHPLVGGFISMNKEAGIPTRIIASPEPFPMNIFFYEALLNRILLNAVDEYNIDQINWPAKGMDGPMYKWEGELF